MNEGVTIDRTLRSVPSVILKKFLEAHNIQNSAKPVANENITYVDILYVILERGLSKSECRKII
jgi:hypothetical protein